MTEAQGASSEVIFTARDVSVSFRSGDTATTVTESVSFDIRHGETLAIVGESGSGKTVTAMSIMNLLPENAERRGELLFRGEDLMQVPPERMRAVRAREISMIFQEPMTALNPVYTVGKQLMDAIRVQERMSRAAARARAVELLNVVGIPEPERRMRSFPHQLSGGQRQRAMIAMAISGNPALLIADEPTTALDVTVQAEILNLLQQLQGDLGMAIALITHDMGVVAEMADRVVVMREGKIVEEADVFSLFVQPQHNYTRKLLEAVPRLTAPGTAATAQPQASLASSTQPQASVAVQDSTQPDQAAKPAALEVENLYVRYPGSWRKPGFLAVEDVSFNIRSGAVTALVGESGSGKSTIGKAIVGLLPVESGSIRVSGKSATIQKAAALRKLRREYSMVFQDPASSLNPRASIGDSIAEPMIVHRPDMSSSARRARVVELLDQVQLPGKWYERFPHELSGGQRQRVGIARALALNPKLLIADEPTSALDVSVQAAVLDIFLELQEELGFSCLFISHDLAVVELLSADVVVLQHGKVVESGRTIDVLQTPRENYTKRLVAAAPVPDPTHRRSSSRPAR